MTEPDLNDDELMKAIKSKKEAKIETKKQIGISPEMETAEMYGQIHDIQDASLASTQRALKMVGETEKVGVSSLGALKQQGGKLVMSSS